MIASFNLSGYRINLVLRHRFEKDLNLYDQMKWKNEYKLGLWLKTYRALSKPKNKPLLIAKGNELSRGYMFGAHLIICNCWVDICHNPLTLNIKE